MKIAVLSNSQMAVPAIASLAQHHGVSALGISGSVKYPDTDLPALAGHFHIPVTEFTRQNFATQINFWLEKIKPDLLLVFTFPYRIPAQSLSIPALGCYNFHFALLPEFRGPQPIFWQIKTGQKYGGITVHKMDSEFDTGPILLRERIPISSETTYGQHCSELAKLAVSTLQKFILQLTEKILVAKEQDESNAKYWPRPELNDLFINWEKMSSQEITSLINATNGWNRGAYTLLNQQPIRLVQVSSSNHTIPSGTLPGSIMNIAETSDLIVACADGHCLKADIIMTDETFITGQRMKHKLVQPENYFQSISTDIKVA